MLNNLRWQPLTERGEIECLILLFKNFINGFAAVSHHFLTPGDGRTKANHGKELWHIRADYSQPLLSIHDIFIKMLVPY